MTAQSRVPPGRAGRLRLRRSLDTALRGAGLLERKLHILHADHRRLLRAAEDASRTWEERVSEAETWLRRAVVLGGERSLEAAQDGVGPAVVAVGRSATMGVRHPSGFSCTVPERAAGTAVYGNTALVHAEGAYREVLRAAGEYAAARSAARAVGDAVLSTRRRVRALRRHWIPRLEQALERVDLALEQAEHEDVVRRRWAAPPSGG
ncbi:V-type ATP synthase subunit D [Streptomyces meridianus]|uniref:V-type ATP synthase subunit D n=1 Tax=Streptomyces meridianus TaxID=2938945 RepID=A0ABT0XB55_9ACTN|nr:V-type ATP synthase subunit D [Streptomyces meridianus]MCM2579748.1 V-type ATP synthase subunit D [Streptomyces meridianus]